MIRRDKCVPRSEGVAVCISCQQISIIHKSRLETVKTFDSIRRVTSPELPYALPEPFVNVHSKTQDL